MVWPICYSAQIIGPNPLEMKGESRAHLCINASIACVYGTNQGLCGIARRKPQAVLGKGGLRCGLFLYHMPDIAQAIPHGIAFCCVARI